MLLVTAVTAVMATCLGLVFSGRIAPFGMRLGRMLHVVPPLPPPPAPNPPLETVVADLRRIRCELDSPLPGLPMAKRRGTLLAYEDRLLDACRALDVPNTLDGVEEGIDRDWERLRIEALLEEAGLVMQQRSR